MRTNFKRVKMRFLFVIVAWMTLIRLSLADLGNSDDRDKSPMPRFDADDKLHQWRSREDKAFAESGVCKLENRSYVVTCKSGEKVDGLRALRNSHCFCDRDCHQYGDCCLNVLSESANYATLAWSCREVKEGFEFNIPIYVLQKCPEVWEDIQTRTMCEIETWELEKKGENFSYLQDIPVKSKMSGIFYRNVFCAACNFDTELEKWKSIIYCPDISPDDYGGDAKMEFTFSESSYNTRTRNFRNVLVGGRKTNCRIIIHDFKLKTLIQEHNARLCKPVTNTCSEDSDDEAVQKCNSYTSYVYENGFSFNSRKLYKNFHCALCNHVNVSKLKCADPYQPPFRIDPRDMESKTILNFLFDFNFVGDNNQIGVTSPCKLSQGLLWDRLTKTCSNFTCGSLFERKGSKCVPRVTENQFGGLNDTCLKRILPSSAFVIHANKSVSIKRTGRILHPDEYEVNEKDGDVILSINVCAEEGSFLLHLSRVQYWLSELTLSLSIICLIFHLLVYSILKELRNCPGKILMSLSACLICGHIFLLSGQHIAEFYWACYVSGVLTHFGYLSSFLWMNVMAYDIYRTFSTTQSRNANNTKTFIKYSLYCWITAAFITSFSVMLDNVISPENEFRPKYGDPICWFNQRKGLLIFFILPIFTLLVMNVTFFVITAFRIRKISKETKMVKNFSDRVRYLLYIKLTVVLGLTWLLGILAGFLRVSFLWYPFIILNGLQGVFIFVSFTMKRKIIKMLLIKFRIHSDSYKMGKQSAIRRAIYTSLSNLSTLQTTVTSQLPNADESREILKAVRKINPDSVLEQK